MNLKTTITVPIQPSNGLVVGSVGNYEKNHSTVTVAGEVGKIDETNFDIGWHIVTVLNVGFRPIRATRIKCSVKGLDNVLNGYTLPDGKVCVYVPPFLENAKILSFNGVFAVGGE